MSKNIYQEIGLTDELMARIRPAKPKYHPNTKQLVIFLAANGSSMADIRRETKVPYHTARQWVEDFKVTIGRKIETNTELEEWKKEALSKPARQKADHRTEACLARSPVSTYMSDVYRKLRADMPLFRNVFFFGIYIFGEKALYVF